MHATIQWRIHQINGRWRIHISQVLEGDNNSYLCRHREREREVQWQSPEGIGINGMHWSG